MSSKGLIASKFVLKPNFSACAMDSSVVPAFEQSDLNFSKSFQNYLNESFYSKMWFDSWS